MRRKWTHESIKNAIIALHLSGVSLSYSGIMNNERALLQAATRYFGTWEAAVNSTGLSYDSCRKYRKPVPEYISDTAPRRRNIHKRPRSLFD